MAIIKNHYSYSTGVRSSETLFPGRVLEVVTRLETRNWSDTLDYTDMRDTQCTYALVWLGTRGLPPYRRTGDLPQIEWEAAYNADRVRDLEFHEQFAWVDCTNIFSDRCGFTLEAHEDAVMGQGDPLMWANLIAWRNHEEALRAERAAAAAAEVARYEAIRKAEEAKRAAREAKRLAAQDKSKAAAEALLARVPMKGSEVTLGAVKGKLSWMGLKLYRGKWQARIGVKDARGNMHWADAAAVAR